MSLSIDASINGGNPPVAGTTATYDMHVNNEGPADALSVQLSTSVPAGTTLQSFSFPGGWSCTAPPPGGTGAITCTTPTFVPGSDLFTLVINVPRALARGTLVTLNASVTTTSPDPDMSDNSVTLDAPVVWQSSLNLTKTAPPSAFAGSPITYTLTVTNGGPSDAADLVLNDVLPAAALFDSVTAPGWTCTTPAAGATGAVDCTLLQFGTSGTVTIQVHTAPSTPSQTLTNDATLSASTEISPHNASANTALSQSADVALTKSASALVAGTDVTYTIVVNNGGPSDAANVALDDPLPATLTFQSVTAAGWICTSPAVGTNGTVHCTRGLFTPGSSTITLVAHVPAATPGGTTITNTATATSTTPDPTTPNTGTASGTTGLQSDIAVTNSDAPDPALSGGPLSYTISLTNNGPSAAPNASLSVAIPVTLGFVSVSAPPGWNCAALPVGGSGTLSCTSAAPLALATPAGFIVNTTVLPTNVGGSSISTTATGSSAAMEPNPADNAATATTTISSPAAVSATKQANGSIFYELFPFTYSVVLRNSGSTQGDYPGDEMVDQLPATLTLISAGATAGTAVADLVNNRVTWNGTVPAGGSVTVTIQARPNAGTAGVSIANQAAVNFDADGNGTNESSAVSNDVTSGGPTVVVPQPAANIPTMSWFVLIALGLVLAAAAFRHLG